MKPALLAFPLLAALLAGAGVKASEAAPPGVTDVRQARVDYMLKCQGCHRPDGSFRTLPKLPSMPQILDRIGHAVGTTWSIVPTGCRYCWSG